MSATSIDERAMKPVANGDRSGRINLILKGDLLNRVDNYVSRTGQTNTDALRKLIRLGLMVDCVDQDPKQTLILREEGETDREIWIT